MNTSNVEFGLEFFQKRAHGLNQQGIGVGSNYKPIKIHERTNYWKRFLAKGGASVFHCGFDGAHHDAS